MLVSSSKPGNTSVFSFSSCSNPGNTLLGVLSSIPGNGLGE